MSTAKIDKLVRMANQIGDFFAPMGEDAATIGVATHLKRFWTPKMISEMIAWVDSGHVGLNPAAARGVAALKREARAGEKAKA
jgi:formate dehydrogenase subunit delta